MSYVALALSLVGLGWNLGLTWVRWPRVVVDLNADYGVRGDQARITVVNVGSEAMSIRSIGFCTPDGSPVHDLEHAITQRREGEEIPEGGDVPKQIDGRGCAVWRYSNVIVGTLRGFGPVHAYVLVYRAGLPWSRKSKSYRVLSERAIEFN